MSLDARLNKIMPGLTAKERGLLVLGALKRDEPEDPAWRQLMPAEQYDDFNRYIGLMNAANVRGASFILAVELLTSRQDVRLSWLATLKLWRLHMVTLSTAALDYLHEPVTASDFAALVQEQRDEYVLVAELAEVLVDHYDGWCEEDYEQVEGQDEPVLSDAAWDRVADLKTRELRRLAANGTLPSSGRGAGLRLNQGAFYDWLGEAVPVYPERAADFDVFPDSCAELVAAGRQRLFAMLDCLEKTPFNQPRKVYGYDLTYSDLIVSLEDLITKSLCTNWHDVRAIDQVLTTIAGEFDGQGPLAPDTRETLERATQTVMAIRDYFAALGPAVELTEPGEDCLAEAKELLDRHGDLFQ